MAALFDGRIGFGTAGLRAPMGPGPTRMNRLVVRQATAGLMSWLGEGARVVIGYDARHRSDRFAADVADVVTAAGGRAERFDRPVPTPVLAHAVLHRAAEAGVMITASHNPAADNGYKLYLADGIQLAEPTDRIIAAAIDRVADVAPPGSGAPPPVLGPVEIAAHRAAATAACLTGHRDVRCVVTPMHGVGGRYLLDAMAAAGFPTPSVVAAQADPDPDVPTVAFPNPEEAGALDAAIGLAAGTGADLVLATDPDADRLAVAVPDRAGDWVRLTGDQVGVLLAEHVITHRADRTRPAMLASSLVSSRLVTAVAAEFGVASIRTLTGFKWVARPIVDQPDVAYLLGYEEALGYCVGDRVRDKDGISAALVMAELVAETRAAGRTLWDRLDDLTARHGAYRTQPVTRRFSGPEGMTRRAGLMTAALEHPPGVLAGRRVTDLTDLGADGGPLPPTSGVVWDLDDGSRVVVRPSGTEPKLKVYIETVDPVGPAGIAAADQQADASIAALAAAVTAWFDAR
ncbi:MAG: phospho-sugar mutase [Acidimicrobiales bacterium]